MRTRKQIGEMAIAIYDQLAKVEFTSDELKIFGNAIWAKKPIIDLEQVPEPSTGRILDSRVATGIKLKLVKVAEELDKLYPIPEAPVTPPPADPALDAMGKKNDVGPPTKVADGAGTNA